MNSLLSDLGHTRGSRRNDHFLLTPDTFVRAPLPGMRNATAIVHASPACRALKPRWVAGRAAQLGTTGAVVVRDGVPLPRAVRRSTFYRHTEGWLRVS